MADQTAWLMMGREYRMTLGLRTRLRQEWAVEISGATSREEMIERGAKKFREERTALQEKPHEG